MTHLGPLEQEIMELVWSSDGLTVREVVTALQTKKKIAYTTVMTVMGRLCQKGLLVKKTDANRYSYQSTNTQAVTLHSLVKQTLEKFVDQFGDQAVAAFVDEVEQLQSQPKQKKK